MATPSDDTAAIAAAAAVTVLDSGGRLGPGRPVVDARPEVPLRRLVVAAQALELELPGIARALVVDDEVPVPGHVRQRRISLVRTSQEVRVRDRIDVFDERAAARELERRRPVQGDTDAERGIAVAVSEAVAQGLDRVPDRVRVPEVDEERLAGYSGRGRKISRAITRRWICDVPS
jgi:hypothetical protein